MSARLELARRAVACKGLRWLPGMRDVQDGDRCTAFDAEHDFRDGNGPRPAWKWASEGLWAELNEGHEWLPDLDDPATLGCLLELVREAWGDPGAYVRGPERDNVWRVMVLRPGAVRRGSVRLHGDSEARALIAALEAAP